MSDRLQPNPAFIYVIGHETGPQKIGYSNNPRKRALALKAKGEPRYKVHFFASVGQANARNIEALAHSILSDKALGRERFDVTPAEARAAIEAAVVRYGRGERAPERDDLRDQRVVISFSNAQLAALEEWRWSQPHIRSLSDAIRALVRDRLDSEPAQAIRLNGAGSQSSSSSAAAPRLRASGENFA